MNRPSDNAPPFNRHISMCPPPQGLQDIDADLKAVRKPTIGLLAEVYS